MTKVIVDPATEAKLSQARVTLELCDAQGRVLGHFVPIPDTQDREPQVSEEELDRRERTGGGRRLPDIFADLEKRK